MSLISLRNFLLMGMLLIVSQTKKLHADDWWCVYDWDGSCTYSECHDDLCAYIDIMCFDGTQEHTTLCPW